MTRVLRPSLLAAVILAATACQSGQPTGTPSAVTPRKLDTPQARYSYLVGVDLARQVGPVKNEIDLAITLDALRSTLDGARPALDDAQLDVVRREFTVYLREKREAEQKAMIARNEEAGAAFLAENARKNPSVKSTPSGLQYEVVTEGKGARPQSTDTVRVHYIGRRFDGTTFDNSYERDHPVEIVLNQVMPGWSEGLSLMTVGSKYRLWMPAKLGYGDQGLQGEIEPGAGLSFEVELLEIAGQ
ncbi:FKBP-type peptidyl-prolyl cis-trans isomerase [Tahibacter amnicola]|uniref:Peptidyl-prolyl cis-trans isomerase n=1 Tax=Tahibacter amnicola TaxID=2976241 RepID=A0ABY6BKR5_9GAMM|nr:FKBP-type peptidyl-prolyl cis-trans isomerase [Tahibacter amnicola]UXI70455.1 FKBP-type peptidyl-prolyl cis-trans isomerase [Tahibacter amnicola]